MKIALVGNPNCGKTTVFNELTGSSQYVGNWPGVTVEKKSGKLIRHKDIEIIDLPGIYSLSPYTLEEVITRDYLVNERPDVVINIVDASNLERNLYLTTQVIETGIPVVIALNMIDIVEKEKDSINIEKLSLELGCPIVRTSAVKGQGMPELIKAAMDRVSVNPQNISINMYKEDVKNALLDIKGVAGNSIAHDYSYYVVKLFERDDKIIEQLNLNKDQLEKIDSIISNVESAENDDSESIIINERYDYIKHILRSIYKKNRTHQLSLSDKIDKVVTNKWLALPIFFCVLWFIYYVSISTVGDMTIGYVGDAFSALQDWANNALLNAGASEIVIQLVTKGIIESIGAIFPFVPQLLILFFFLSLLEDSGYMARIAFIMDRIFRKFGLSGKSFIPMLMGTGCSIPGIMAARTIENEADRKMTIILTPFIPCGAKLPVFSMFIAMLFADATWVAPTIYIIGIIGVIVSGILLKKTKRFAGDPAPFVMELPSYKLPRLKGVIIHMWEKAKGFIKKAGTVIFVANLILWFLRSFSFSMAYVGEDGMSMSMLAQVGEYLRYVFIPLGFGDTWAPAVASITGLIAKEVVVSTFATVGQVMPIHFTQVSAFAFIVFTIFAAPCFAAIGATRRELGNIKDTLFAVGFQTGVAYMLALLVNQIGSLIFKGKSAMEAVVLDYRNMEAASESVEMNHNLVMYIFAALFIIAIAVVIYDKINSHKKYSKFAEEK